MESVTPDQAQLVFDPWLAQRFVSLTNEVSMLHGLIGIMLGLMVVMIIFQVYLVMRQIPGSPQEPSQG